MKTGWLVYDAWNTDRNAFFIERWLQAAARRGVGLHVVLTENISYGYADGKAFLKELLEDARPDFVVMRAAHPLLSAHLEKMGIPCFNSARVAEICNDKRQTHALLAGELPMMPTAFLNQEAFLNPFSYPVVVKGAHGCGGRSVYLADNEEEYRDAVRKIAPDSFVVQPLCDQPGKDVRVYVLGQRMLAAMLRHQERDFRSNVGLGGGSHPIPLTDELAHYVEKVMRHFAFGLVGVDFIYHQGRLVFNEIEDAVGTRMLYMHTSMDIAEEYLNLILSSLGM